MAEQLRFRRAVTRSSGSLRGLVVLFVVVSTALLLRPYLMPSPPAGLVVEVQGQVPNPGFVRIDPPTVRQALRAAGAPAIRATDQPLHEGDRVVVGLGGWHIAPSSDPLLVALPVDLNTADVSGLEAVPGIGPSLARAIVADRATQGPFATVQDVDRVRGVGPSTLAKITPFLAAFPTGSTAGHPP